MIINFDGERNTKNRKTKEIISQAKHVQCTFIHTLRNEEDRAMLYPVRQDQFERQNCSSVDQKSFDTQ